MKDFISDKKRLVREDSFKDGFGNLGAKTKKQEVLEGEIKANSGQLKVNILGQICKSLQINVGFDLIFAQISHRFCIGFEQILHRFCKDFSQIGTDLHRFCYKLAQICKDFFTNWHRFA